MTATRQCADRWIETDRGLARCPEHADVAVPGNCGPCADTRKANQARPRLSLVESPTQKCLIHMTPDVAHCNGCAADRKAAS